MIVGVHYLRNYARHGTGFNPMEFYGIWFVEGYYCSFTEPDISNCRPGNLNLTTLLSIAVSHQKSILIYLLYVLHYRRLSRLKYDKFDILILRKYLTVLFLNTIIWVMFTLSGNIWNILYIMKEDLSRVFHGLQLRVISDVGINLSAGQPISERRIFTL